MSTTKTPNLKFSDLPELLTVQQVATFCGCHDRSVRRWVSQNRLAIVRVGSNIRIVRESLRAFLGL